MTPKQPRTSTCRIRLVFLKLPFQSPYCQRHQSVVIVEGYFDALFPARRAIGPLVAVTKAVLSEEQLKSLTELGVNEVTICFDADDAGKRGTQWAVELCARMQVTNFVFDLRGSGAKDPAEFVAKIWRYRIA